MKFRPLHDRVVQAHRRRRKDLAASSFRMAQEKPSRGEITAWPGRPRRSGKLIDRPPGRRACCSASGPHRGQARRPELLIMKESDIAGVLTNLPTSKKKAA